MYLSSDACLRKIKEGVYKKNFVVSDAEIKETCILCNFNIKSAIQLLIDHEKIKENLIYDLNQKNYNISNKMIKQVCNRFKYNYDKVKEYLLRFGETKKKIIKFLNKKKITLTEDIIENEINLCSGFYVHTVSNLNIKYNIIKLKV